MPATTPLPLDQAIKSLPEGTLTFSTNGEAVNAGHGAFASKSELISYVESVFGAQADHDGARGAIISQGPYFRMAGSARLPVTFGDPVLDAISTPNGQVVVGSETYDFSATANAVAASNKKAGGVVRDVPTLKFTGNVNGAQRWATDDGSLVEYRLGTGTLTFQAWKDTGVLTNVYWTMGGLISVIDTPAMIQAAYIESHPYMSVTAPCQRQKVEQGTLYNSNLLKVTTWGAFAQEPERVAVFCEAQWHNERFADLVTAGDGCLNYKTDQWPNPFPPAWNPKSTILILDGDWTDGSSQHATILVSFSSLSIDMSAFGRPSASGTITDYNAISVSFPDDKTYTGELQAPDKILWSNGSTWTKIVSTIFDLNGSWTDGGARSAVIYEGASALRVDMSDFDRPNAQGSVVNDSAVSVSFPDDKTYTAQLQQPNKIVWSNGSVWTKKP
jgi:hypothetical protein